MSEAFVFRRPDLASRMTDVALGADPLAGTSGLFLAAPRRTGKSTFLKNDLIPALIERKVLPVYVDLWSDRNRDPAEVVVEQLKHSLQNLDAAPMKLARSVGMSKIGIGSWLSMDLEKLGKPGGATITDAFEALIRKTDRPVVLIVDEAQHALTTEAGITAMFSLKSARDTLNSGVGPMAGSNVRLGLVFTGSHRDKLASLVIGKAQPFFGASITSFPFLGTDFAHAYANYVNAHLAADRLIDQRMMERAFEIVSFRPELLQRAVRQYATGSIGTDATGGSVVEQAFDVREQYWQESDSQWSAMTPLQQAVLRRIIERGERFKPFDAEAMTAYSENTGGTIAAADAQSALDALREKGIVIRLERGRYSLEDLSLVEWLEDRSSTSAFKPK